MHKETLYHIGTELVVLLVTVVWFQYQTFSINKKLSELEDVNDELQTQIKALRNIVEAQSSQIKQLIYSQQKQSYTQPIKTLETKQPVKTSESTKSNKKIDDTLIQSSKTDDISSSIQSTPHFISLIQLDHTSNTHSKPTITEIVDDSDQNNSNDRDLDQLISSELEELQ